MSAPHPRWSLASQAVPPTVPTVDLTRLTKLHWILNLLGLLAVHVDIEVPISPHCVGETKDLLIFLPHCIPEWQLLGIKYLQSWGTNRGVHMAKISNMGGVQRLEVRGVQRPVSFFFWQRIAFPSFCPWRQRAKRKKKCLPHKHHSHACTLNKGVVGREGNGEGAKGIGKGKGGGGTVTVRWRGEMYRTTQRQKR